MADIKRPVYFKTQFLQEEDFNDEQSYHRDQLKRHHQKLHSPGIVSDLDVIPQNPPTGSIRVQAGTAIDSTGQEIVLAEPQDISLSTSAAGSIPINIWYSEVPDLDPTDPPGTKATRMIVKPKLSPRDGAGPNTAAGDGPAVPLAIVSWNGSSVSATQIDKRVRQLATATIPPNSIGINQLKLQLVAQGIGVTIPSGPSTLVPVQTNVPAPGSTIYWPTIAIRSTTGSQSKIQAVIVYMQTPNTTTVDIGIGFNNQGGPAVVDWRVYIIGA